MFLGIGRAPAGGGPDATQPDSGRAFGHSQSGKICLKMSIKWARAGSQRELQLPWGGSRADFEMQPDATRGRPFGGFPKWAKPRETQGKWAIRGGPAGGGSEVDFEMQPDATRADAREAFRELRPARKTLKNACKTQNRGLLEGGKKVGRLSYRF